MRLLCILNLFSVCLMNFLKILQLGINVYHKLRRYIPTITLQLYTTIVIVSQALRQSLDIKSHFYKYINENVKKKFKCLTQVKCIRSDVSMLDYCHIGCSVFFHNIH